MAAPAASPGEGAVTFQPTWTTLIPLCASVLAAGVAMLGRLNRGIPGGRAFTLMAWSVCGWMLCSALSDAAAGGIEKNLFVTLGYVGLVTAAPLLVRFSLWYRSSERGLHWWKAALLWIVPVGILVSLAAFALLPAGYHALPFMSRVLGRRILFGYSAAYTFAACLILTVLRSGAKALYIRQTAVLLTGFLLPIIGGVFAQFPGIAEGVIDPVGLGFAFMGLVLLIGLRKFQLLDIVPVARNALIEKMIDGLIVFDAAGRIVDINPAAEALLGSGHTAIGSPGAEVLGAWHDKVLRLLKAGDGHVEAAHLSDPGKWCDLQLTTLRDSRGAAYCWLLVVRDLTDRKNVERERETLIEDLGDALADVQTLSGLLPICASCKKIRNDSGYWEQLEAYITEHSEAQFSHGICPECARKLYPGLVDDPPGTSS
jgi:PAS domain S-box-containing protein